MTVLLPDEYDEIERSVGPFRAFTKDDLAARMARSRRISEVVEIVVKNGNVSVVVRTILRLCSHTCCLELTCPALCVR